MRPTKGNDRSHDPPSRLARVGIRVGAVDETLGWGGRGWGGRARRHVGVEAVRPATRSSRGRWPWVRGCNVVSTLWEAARRRCEHALKLRLGHA